MGKILNTLLIGLLLVFPIAEVGKVQLMSVSFTLNDIFVFLTVLTWFVFNFKSLNSFKKTALFKPIFLFISVCAISLVLNIFKLNTESFLVALLYLLRWILYSFIYFILVTSDKKFLKKFQYLLLIPIGLILSIGFIQFIFYNSLRNLYYLGWDEHLYRLFSSFFDPNFAGAFLTLSLLFLIYLNIKFIYQKSLFKSIFLTVFSILNLVAIYLTYSRSALIMLFVSLAVFLVLLGKKKIFIVISIFLILLIFLSPRSFQTEGTNIFRIASSESRLDSARLALDIISKNPIIGVGFNAYRYVQFKNGSAGGTLWLTTHSGAGTDNSFLFVFATTGIIGLVIYLYFLTSIFKLGKEKLGKNLLSVVLISSLAGIMVDSMFINSLFFVYIMEWIWIMAALTENS